jgi:hypothetical protein
VADTEGRLVLAGTRDIEPGHPLGVGRDVDLPLASPVMPLQRVEDMVPVGRKLA